MKKKKRGNDTYWYYLLPLMFIVTIVPLIVYLKVVPLSGPSFDYWIGTAENFDFFSYYKGVWLIIAVSIGLFLTITRYFQSDPSLVKKDLKPYYIAAGFYFLLIICSTFLSEYRSVAISGFPDRYEGVYVLSAYLIIFFITTALVSNEKQVKIILYSIIAGSFTIGIIGLLQYIGYDLLKMDFVKSIFLPEQYEHISDGLEFKFDKYTIYATLYHYNYVGSYTAMLFPLFFSLFVLVKDKKLKVCLGILAILMGIICLGSNARSGIVGASLAMLVFIILINKIVLKYWKYFVLSFTILLIVTIGLNHVSNGFIATRISSLVTDVKVIIGMKEGTPPSRDDLPLKDIRLNGNHGTVIIDSETLNFTYEDSSLSFSDGNNKIIKSSYDLESGLITLDDSIYQDFTLTFGQMNNNTLLVLEKDTIQLIFDLNSEKIGLVDNKGNEVSLEPVESWGFEGYELIGSSRGYIWSRSLPLLKDHLLFGYGPDTFAIAFPQHDIFGKMHAYDGDMWHLVDKPHNMYLQIAINTGIISLLAFLLLVGYYLYHSFRIYLSNALDEFLPQVGVGVTVAIVGYLGAAMFNDSVVSVAPIFWCLLGLGVSINYIVVKQLHGKHNK